MYPGIQVHEAALAVDWQFALIPQGEGLHGSITSGRTVAKTDFSREKKTTNKEFICVMIINETNFIMFSYL